MSGQALLTSWILTIPLPTSENACQFLGGVQVPPRMFCLAWPIGVNPSSLNAGALFLSRHWMTSETRLLWETNTGKPGAYLRLRSEGWQ